MQIEIVRAIYLDCQLLKVGDVVDVKPKIGNDLIATGAGVEFVPEPQTEETEHEID